MVLDFPIKVTVVLHVKGSASAVGKPKLEEALFSPGHYLPQVM